ETTQMKTVAPARKLLTAEEFYAFVQRPENERRWFELVQGEVIELPVPQRLHGLICGNIAGLLFIYKQQQGSGALTTNDAGVLLKRNPDTVRGPDVAFFAEESDEPGYSTIP